MKRNFSFYAVTASALTLARTYKVRRYCVCLLLTFIGYSASVHSSDSLHEAIITVATDFALAEHADKEKVEVRVNPPDSRLTLSSCQQPLETYWPPGASKIGQTTVGVECRDSQPWKIFLRASIRVFDHVVVLSTDVNAGDLVSEVNTEVELLDLSGVREGTFSTIEQLVGHRFKRRSSSGRALTMSMLSIPKMVAKGDDVAIIADAGSLQVRMRGVAMDDGRQGSRVRVRNVTSKRVIQGTVSGKGIVSVNY
ncbi:MAG: flagellar basal body P-ring formation protein FlgA [Granulosicoccus sp.]|nr:flagellar basal body P-ring formation protein FlgA [Granulosicoccus sp.]